VNNSADMQKWRVWKRREPKQSKSN